MKKKVLIAEKIHRSGLNLLKEKVDLHELYNPSYEELIRNVYDKEAIIVRGAVGINKEIIDNAPELKVIGVGAIGTNHIDVAYAKEKGIEVYNVPAGSTYAVPELTIGLMITVARKIVPAYHSVLEGEWDKHTYQGRQLKDKALGIIALGKIGSRVAKLAQAFDMNVIAFDPYVKPELAKEVGVKLVDIDTLCERADVISIHAPLTEDTRDLINEERIKKMKPGVIILNMGRGGILNEDAAYRAIKEGRIYGLGLDVMEKEPPGKSRLFELENVVVTPHIGAATDESQQVIALEIAEKVLKALNLM
ncbi:MAG: hydroxyacid dehydrogenase [Dethiobacteria bacterium]|jgi:D-3-phosphoglycerate dehydrogenase